MYWSYLINSKNTYGMDVLTFESGEDLTKLTHEYCQLVIDDFFSSFSREYDTIFISQFDPTQEPLNKVKNFSIGFNDVNKAIKLIKN